MTIEQRVRHFIEENFYVGEGEALRDDTLLVATGIMDSTGVLELLGFLESEFEIRISDEETLPENLDSIARIAAFVGRKRQAAVG